MATFAQVAKSPDTLSLNGMAWSQSLTNIVLEADEMMGSSIPSDGVGRDGAVHSGDISYKTNI